ncbi:hypothetical protein BN6_47840 [Saccharothrix espanaensis DSM 44229]|uniref:Saccharopine dehydrogenase NADP binding domain-containing protein n=2 Tax=Saccharothrix espanaensis TaxID=103731 RepID=K0K5D1_SACES|nr:hypothetical protein BN6_47840 [Saccharothrix espanaensis DSM 44229]
MVLGAGDLGRRVFHELAHGPGDRHVRLVGREEDPTLRAANLSRFSALQRGYHPTVDHATTDLNDIDRTAECIAAFDPDVLFLAASFQSWWVITTLPGESFQRLRAANYGPWLPMHLVPVHKAMQAVRRSGTSAVVVNAAYPDAVHPILTSVGLSPDVGIGNVANNVPGIRVAAADLLGVPVPEVDVRLVAHHYVSHRLSRAGDPGRAGMALTIGHGGQDLTDRVDTASLLKRLPLEYRRTGGMPGQAMTAASALSVLVPLADRRDALVHAPGPGGLVGGYPVAIEGGRIRTALPDSVSLEEAVAVNLSGQVHDGIDAIDADGTTHFEPSSMAVLTAELGYECRTMRLDEAEGRAAEIRERFEVYRGRAVASAS